MREQEVTDEKDVIQKQLTLKAVIWDVLGTDAHLLEQETEDYGVLFVKVAAENGMGNMADKYCLLRDKLQQADVQEAGAVLVTEDAKLVKYMQQKHTSMAVVFYERQEIVSGNVASGWRGRDNDIVSVLDEVQSPVNRDRKDQAGKDSNSLPSVGKEENTGCGRPDQREENIYIIPFADKKKNTVSGLSDQAGKDCCGLLSVDGEESTVSGTPDQLGKAGHKSVSADKGDNPGNSLLNLSGNDDDGESFADKKENTGSDMLEITADFIVQGFEETGVQFFDRIQKRKNRLPWNILYTKRTCVREITLDDMEELFELYQGEGITDFTEPLYEWQKEAEYTKSYIEHMYYYYGYGMWVVRHRESGRLLGRAGIGHREEGDRVLMELGYIIGREYQNQGYATEVCQAVMEYAAKELQMAELHCMIHPQNYASRRVARRLGFTLRDAQMYNAEGLLHYHKLL